jgi:hypothetical protein
MKRYYFLRIFIVIFTLAISSTAYCIDVLNSFEGTYLAGSRACEGSFLILQKENITWDDCKKVSYRVLDVDNKYILLEIRKSSKCHYPFPFIRLEGVFSDKSEPNKWGSIAIYGYNTRSQALSDNYQMSCSAGRVDPSLAEDQTAIFLHSKSAAKREEALHNINLQPHRERNKYNEKGLNDPSPLVRSTAAYFLRGNPSHFLPLLISIMAHDSDQTVRYRAAESLMEFVNSNGSDGCMDIDVIVSHLDMILSSLHDPKISGMIVSILGANYSGEKFLPCCMPNGARLRVLQELRNEQAKNPNDFLLKAIRNVESCKSTQ